MDSVLVYRLDRETRAKVPLGILVERRKSERGQNFVGMLRRARKEFAKTQEDLSEIFIEYGA
jgi:hypothetical protein